MFRTVTDDNPYKEWLDAAHLLEPSYDYFNFADVHKKDIDTTNCIYLSLLNHHLSKATKKSQKSILSAIKLFNGRRSKSTKFYSQYSEYWEYRKTENASLQLEKNARIIKKRTFEALQDINESFIENIVDASKRLRNEENAQSTNNHAKSSVEDAKILFQEMTGSKTLNLDDEGVAVIVDETLLAELRQKSNLKKYSLSKATSSLLKLVSQADTSISVLRNVIKSYELPSDESFDTVLHADVNFIETVGLHFINLALSPRNPLHFQTLERTTAVQTSIFFLNSLFLSVNDRISFSWIEIETLLTEKTKWDGVGFCPALDKKIGMVLIEFSGGILWNKTKKKAINDVQKIEKGVIDFIEYTNLNIGHFIRYHDLELYFEVICHVDGTYVRRTCTALKFPTTPTEFSEFFKQMPKVLEWKQSLMDSISQLSSSIKASTTLSP